MKRPNLFILGAPKCGTTALAQWLSSHPEVFMSSVKEPHYFCEDHRLTPTLETFEALFADADPARHRWVCEASVWHLFSETAVPNILCYAPDARFIVMVRNPLEMALSMHGQHRFNGNELVVEFDHALALNDRRNLGEPVGVRPGYAPTRHLAYFESCALGAQVQRLFTIVQRERVHVVVYDDLVASAERSYSDVLAFLGLEQSDAIRFERINAAKERRSYFVDGLTLKLAAMKQRLGIERRLGLLAWLRRKNRRPVEREAPAIEVLHRMAEGFADDVAVLGRELGRDFSHWLRVEEVSK